MGAGDGSGPRRQRQEQHRQTRQGGGEKTAANTSFGANMPLMSSAFDTAMWLSAA